MLLKEIKIRTADKALDKLLERLDAAEAKKEVKEEKERKWTPEEWYQELKRRWYFHNTSWYMRLLNGHDGKGCTLWNGCIPECAFYEKEGRLEEREIEEAIQGLARHPSLKMMPHEHHPDDEREGQHKNKKKEEEQHQQYTKSSSREMASSVSKEEEKQRTMKEYFDEFKGKEFWIWNRHLHLLQFLRTQGKCCFNHMIGEPEKYDRPMPLF